MVLTKCCCCFNLKYGYFAWGILSMIGRLIVCINFYHVTTLIMASSTDIHPLRISQIISINGGWAIGSAVCLFFTLKGIVQERSILIYPYIVILILELILVLIFGIFIAIFGGHYYTVLIGILVFPLIGAFKIYEVWSLISLYKHMRSNEKTQYVGNLAVMKTV